MTCLIHAAGKMQGLTVNDRRVSTCTELSALINIKQLLLLFVIKFETTAPQTLTSYTKNLKL